MAETPRETLREAPQELPREGRGSRTLASLFFPLIGLMIVVVFGFPKVLLGMRNSFPLSSAGDLRLVDQQTGPQPTFRLDDVLPRLAGADRMIIMVQVTSNYLDFLENWYTSVADQGYARKVLFLADDLESFYYLRENYPWQTVVLPSVIRMWPVQVPCPEVDWNSTYFNTVVSRRPFYLQRILRHNVSILYNDVDIVWKADPFPFFDGNFDMWVQEDGRVFRGALQRFSGGTVSSPKMLESSAHQICTCFMMLRPTAGTRQIMTRWGQAIVQETRKQGKPVANQGIWNKVLIKMSQSNVKVAVLPVLLFPSGCIFFGGTHEWCRKEQVFYLDAAKKLNSTPIVVHNNWYAGHEPKLKRFKEYNLWLLDRGPDEQKQNLTVI